MNVPHSEKTEFVRYLISGFSAVGTDLATYWILLGPLGPSPAKAISFLTACCVAYLLNKFWTFKAHAHSWSEISKFIGLYAGTFLANVAVNKLVIEVAPELSQQLKPYVFQLGWLTATGVSTILNYIGQKFWVFRKAKAEKLSSSSESI
ncbi:MAG: GtrA family protein [Candidatus Obscuribacterales bacterium]|nr:MAG: GtrA family protein [Candidatus Melainabacteria bacterium]